MFVIQIFNLKSFCTILACYNILASRTCTRWFSLYVLERAKAFKAKVVCAHTTFALKALALSSTYKLNHRVHALEALAKVCWHTLVQHSLSRALGGSLRFAHTPVCERSQKRTTDRTREAML